MILRMSGANWKAGSRAGLCDKAGWSLDPEASGEAQDGRQYTREMSPGEGSTGEEAGKKGTATQGTGSLRVAFFSPETRDLKATQTWCELPVQRGEEVGLEGSSYSAPLPGLVNRLWRLWASTRFLGRVLWGSYWFFVFLPVRLVQVARVRRFDVVFVQRTMFREKSPPVLEWFVSRLLRRPIVLHVDDSLWLKNPRKQIERRCRIADLVITGNDQTADFIRSAGGTVRKVEYGLDSDHYPVKEHAGSRGLVIGLTATGGDVFPDGAAEAVARACAETGSRFVYRGGPVRPAVPALDSIMEWSPWDEDDPTSFLSGFDVAICPLVDDEGTRGKETFKVKEYMVAGLPQVLSPIGYSLQVIDDGVEGFFAESPEEWFDRLMHLLRYPELRNRMGLAARRRIEADYRIETMLDGLAEVCREAVRSG